jgi:hypothetical protein
MMAEVDQFERAMIEACFQEKGWLYWKDPDGDLRADFPYGEDPECTLKVLCMADGAEGEVYLVRVATESRIPREEWDRATALCNAWNRETRWPKAYLHVGDPETETTGQIILEEQLYVRAGIHQELLNDFTETIIGTATEFWGWAHREHGF